MTGSEVAREYLMWMYCTLKECLQDIVTDYKYLSQGIAMHFCLKLGPELVSFFMEVCVVRVPSSDCILQDSTTSELKHSRISSGMCCCVRRASTLLEISLKDSQDQANTKIVPP
jgi:hypothetical protein